MAGRPYPAEPLLSRTPVRRRHTRGTSTDSTGHMRILASANSLADARATSSRVMSGMRMSADHIRALSFPVLPDRFNRRSAPRRSLQFPADAEYFFTPRPRNRCRPAQDSYRTIIELKRRDYPAALGPFPLVKRALKGRSSLSSLWSRCHPAIERGPFPHPSKPKPEACDRSLARFFPSGENSAPGPRNVRHGGRHAGKAIAACRLSLWR